MEKEIFPQRKMKHTAYEFLFFLFFINMFLACSLWELKDNTVQIFVPFHLTILLILIWSQSSV